MCLFASRQTACPELLIRARLRDPAGAALAEAVGAAANIHVDFAAAVDVMRGLIVEVRDNVGRSAQSDVLPAPPDRRSKSASIAWASSIKDS